MSLVEALERLGHERVDPAPRFAPLSLAQERARRHVLRTLDVSLHLARAFVTRVENGAVVVTIGLGSGVTGEMVIPRERLDPGDLIAYADLIALLTASYPEAKQ